MYGNPGRTEESAVIREFDAFRRYDRVGPGRVIKRGWRGVHERLVAMERGWDYYQGDRRFGYGGYSDQGRWKPVAEDIVGHYELSNESSVLMVGCDFGYLLRDIQEARPGIQVVGAEVSDFAISQAPDSLSGCLHKLQGPQLPFQDGSFDLVLCPGLVYTMALPEAFQLIMEIVRVGKAKRFIGLAYYSTAQDLESFKEWSLLGQLLFRKAQWYELLELGGYEGDVKFTSSEDLGLSLID